jgi:hypothetical protein
MFILSCRMFWTNPNKILTYLPFSWTNSITQSTFSSGVLVNGCSKHLKSSA